MITLGGWLGAAAVLANTGHLFCPIVLLWIQPTLRDRALQEWLLYILFPLLALGAAFLLPFWWAIGLYTAWNTYHYAMQHYGFWALTRWRPRTKEQRTTVRTVWLAVTVTGALALPILQWPVSIFHWLGDISLSGWSTTRTVLFFVLVCLLATTGLVLMDHQLRQAFPSIIRVRLGLGFVHFIYSALVWPTALRLKYTQ